MLDGVILYQGQFAARLTVSCMHRYMYMYFICDNASDVIWRGCNCERCPIHVLPKYS